MQTVRILQAVALMLIVALAASCTASKQYTSKLFAPRTPVIRDSQAVVLRFLETDSAAFNTADWVTTDIIMGRDTASQTLALDNFSRTFPLSPAAKVKPDSVTVVKDSKDAVVKTTAVPDEPVAKTGTVNGVRAKKSREE